MRLRSPLQILALLAATLLAFAGAASAQDDVWHASLDRGLEAAKKSGRPVFVVTLWPRSVCNGCDSWRDSVRKDAAVAAQFRRFELVEWSYREAGVIRWTLDHGGTSEDPAAQCFVAGSDGRDVKRLDDARAYTPAAVSGWLRDFADAWEREHPRTAVPFVRGTVTASPAPGGAATDRVPRCAEIDAAREARRPVLVWVARETSDDDKARRAEVAAGRKVERSLLDSRACADAAKGWTLVRLDVSEPDHAALAAALGADRVPALLLWEPDADAPVRVPTTIAASDLAFRLRKAAPKPDDRR